MAKRVGCWTMCTFSFKIYLFLFAFNAFTIPSHSKEQLATIYSISPVDGDTAIISNGAVQIAEGTEVTLSVVGRGLENGQLIMFTLQALERGLLCELGTSFENFEYKSKLEDVKTFGSDLVTATISVKLQTTPKSLYYYMCVSQSESQSESHSKSGSDSSSEAHNESVSNASEQMPDNKLTGSQSTLTLNTNQNQKVNGTPGITWVHQGSSIRLVAKARILPLWLQIIIIVFLLILSGLFSGLNLGLMSLDPTELIIVQNSGSEAEKKFAKSIAPVRKRGNFLLCTLLLGNVLVNSTTTILLDDVGGGIVAVVASTVCIVVFGEIVPQAICSRHGLAVGAKTIWITKIFMVLTSPIAFPLSKLLDVILGDELGQVYNRKKLAELIKLGADKQDIKHEELNIIQGALQLTQKSAVDVMTTIDDVYMVEYSAVLDFETMTDILHTGYTRVPVYDDHRLNIVALLNVKDLAFVDPDDKIPLKTVCKFYNHPITFVFEDTRLDKLLDEFKKGQSHMAFVQRVVEDGNHDPYYDVLGIVTLEDIIEEIIQCEILDETDIITDNQTKRRRHNIRRKDFSVFNQPADNHRICMSPQLTLATFQYLQTTVEPFKEEYISGNILKRLLKQDIFVQLKHDEKSIDSLLYIATKPADHFIIILQGKCSVEIGKDHYRFEAGPFYSFGAEALMIGGHAYTIVMCYLVFPRESQPDVSTHLADKEQIMAGTANREAFSSQSASNLTDLVYSKGHVYIPDFTVRALTDIEFIKVKRHQYIAAQRATLMERQPKTPREMGATTTEDPFSSEWKKASQYTHQSDEGKRFPAHLRHHQRNYSSGNLAELRQRQDFKLSPLISNPSKSENGPMRTIIYSDSQSSHLLNPVPTADPERVQLLLKVPSIIQSDAEENASTL